MKTKEEVKPAWIAALRSGDYEQGQHYMRKVPAGEHVPRYCCLGVLCDLVKDGFGEWETSLGSYISSFLLKEEVPTRASVFPPEGLSRSLTLNWDLKSKLARMNDSGASFEEIADYIEENW